MNQDSRCGVCGRSGSGCIDCRVVSLNAEKPQTECKYIKFNEIVERGKRADYLIIGGYANAGKTTLIREIEEVYPTNVSSLSRVCHRIIEAWTGEPINTKDPVVRQRFIRFIEEGLMTHVDREKMVESCIMYPEEGRINIIETIGGEELKIFRRFILGCGSYMVNVRSTAEQEGIDKRVLLPAGINTSDYWWEFER